jgi:hypothetical protein
MSFILVARRGNADTGNYVANKEWLLVFRSYIVSTVFEGPARRSAMIAISSRFVVNISSTPTVSTGWRLLRTISGVGKQNTITRINACPYTLITPDGARCP